MFWFIVSEAHPATDSGAAPRRYQRRQYWWTAVGQNSQKERRDLVRNGNSLACAVVVVGVVAATNADVDSRGHQVLEFRPA